MLLPMLKTLCLAAAISMVACGGDDSSDGPDGGAPDAQMPDVEVWGLWVFEVETNEGCDRGGVQEVCLAWIDGAPYAEWTGHTATSLDITPSIRAARLIFFDENGDDFEPFFDMESVPPSVGGVWTSFPDNGNECHTLIEDDAPIFVPSADAASGCE